MFTSCCNWMCEDSAEEQQVDGGQGAGRHQSYTNSAFSTQPSPPPPPELTCKTCRGRLDTPAKKHVCVDCKKNYCSSCSVHLEPRPRLCHTCQRFYGNLLERAELMKLKVKELRDYLHLHGISTHLCREKEELVELVLSQQSSPSSDFTPETPPDLADSAHPTDSARLADPPPEPPTPIPPPADPAPPAEHLSQRHQQEEDEQEEEEEEQEEEPEEEEQEAPAAGRRASLSLIRQVDDVEALSVRQLKEILARNFVHYAGCCEKWELVERVRRLYQEQQRLLAENLANSRELGADGAPAGVEENLCKICMDSPIDCVLLECGHMITCTKCGKRMSECPVCRQYVVRAVHVFRS
ncbi:E3 ubiquitin-protein ligase rififylin isoform X1 [Nelusetta ayraudi]|uniref:E3 ubiquitin-protein ligase rififylin isoform X1 n=1 Tax=Nelusetta ayraudi TaxID=303726 RepID=UPI003F72475A